MRRNIGLRAIVFSINCFFILIAQFSWDYLSLFFYFFVRMVCTLLTLPIRLLYITQMYLPIYSLNFDVVYDKFGMEKELYNVYNHIYLSFPS